MQHSLTGVHGEATKGLNPNLGAPAVRNNHKKLCVSTLLAAIRQVRMLHGGVLLYRELSFTTSGNNLADNGE